jgi:hypothetical protein
LASCKNPSRIAVSHPDKVRAQDAVKKRKNLRVEWSGVEWERSEEEWTAKVLTHTTKTKAG